MWGDVSDIFDTNSNNEMFLQIFEFIIEVNGVDFDEHLLTEQFNQSSRRMSPTMIELPLSLLRWVP